MAKKVPGIYRIKNLTNGKVYIGSAAHIPRRLWVHGWMLRRGKHHNVVLQRSWDRDGEAAFAFEAVEIVEDRTQLLVREQHWIDAEQSASDQRGYNLCPVAGSRAGVKMPPGFSEKIAAVHRGRAKSNATRKRMAAAAKGRKNTPEQNRKIAAAVSEAMTPERRAKAAVWGAMSDAPFRGRKHAEESLAKMRAFHANRPRVNGRFVKPAPVE